MMVENSLDFFFYFVILDFSPLIDRMVYVGNINLSFALEQFCILHFYYLGEASYTLIDDSGVEFYLSPKDKSNRKKQGLDVTTKKVTLVEEPEEDPDNLETKDYTKMTTNGTNGKNKITEADEDTDDNDLMLDDYKPSKFLGKSRIPVTNFDSDEDDLDTEGGSKTFLFPFANLQ